MIILNGFLNFFILYLLRYKSTSAEILRLLFISMTAPLIPSNALKSGETDLQVTGNLMRFIVTANLLGLPAISVPVRDDDLNLPWFFSVPSL
ncbi:fatty acid amide hydrolase-like [Olea europaea var. sylvestris]|uniref:fatty acid amide hydrolase-like n=1 Tax=Olea europaea var. sylvestris TaxID=158386 RepID=UPI000C1CEB24|nr:fatty acid amide hydrolase-like [Olea europaea var. sylvestris]